MFQETISDEYIVIQSGTSEGSQIKYRKDNYWYKKDNRGHEGRTEYLCSKLLSFSKLIFKFICFIGYFHSIIPCTLILKVYTENHF